MDGTFTAWVLSLVVPIVQRVLVALGLGTIAYTGLSTLGAALTIAVASSWGQVAVSIIAIATLGGIPQSMGIILGALAARLAYMAVGKIGKMLF